MRRALLLPCAAALLGVQSACLTLDGVVAPGDPREAYDLSSDVIDADLLESVTFESGDGAELHGLWARQDGGGPPLIWFHGNGGALDTYMDRIETYWGWGYEVFAFDYRTYGLSEPEYDRDGMLEEDGLAAVRFVVDETGVPPEEIPWVALSLGAVVAVHTNDEIAARGVVLENMFPSTKHLGDDGVGLDLPEGWFFGDTWAPIREVPAMTSPLFLIHGLDDDFIDPAYGPEIYAQHPGPKRLWQPAGVAHSDIHTVIPDAYEARVRDFFADPDGE